MKKKLRKNLDITRPTISEIEKELKRLKLNRKRRANIKNLISVSIIVAALIIIVTNLWFPVLKVVGSSMQNTLKNKDVVICTNLYGEIDRGEVIAFYNNDKILIKRVVGIPGDSVTMDNDGILYINGERQLETYVMSMSLEPCDVEFPITVPENSYFVLGDKRTASADSRSEIVGTVSEERIIGKVLFRAWPLNKLGEIR